MTSGGGLGSRWACGAPLDEVVLRSYVVGATHMAVGWVQRRASRSTTRATPAT